MWGGPVQDPEGSDEASGPPHNQELNDLKDQYEQQQIMIAQLKEMLRKTEQTVTPQKVEEYANTLSKMNARAKKNKLKKEGEKEGVSVGRKLLTVDSPANEKITLLRQQLEENKAKLAERDKNKKGLEEKVFQLQVQLNDSQQINNQTTPLSLSLAESKFENYSINSNAEELYHILLNKDRKINDQTARILDLQENIKEKDSVIDAKTKAITLMSDSLSKKSKTTLDALDDTKEQMMKMQHTFSIYESEMKIKNKKLVEELQERNLEIDSLKEIIEKNGTANETVETLMSQLEEFQRKNKELEELNLILESKGQEKESKINEMEAVINDLKVVKSELSDNEEVIKLKKQIDENNKNMIKVKAQHKSKIKELNKKVDEFRKSSDSNAKIVQLTNENSKLSQHIAELEEEKGNLQLTTVSTDSTKEQLDVLQAKLKECTDELEAKSHKIQLLEKEIEMAKTEAATIAERWESQVTSQITSIDFEEKLDNLELEKKAIVAEKTLIMQENEKLLEKLDILRKDKQEISSRLDGYMQENIDLMDRLEKLSAEKVSSAESIEIVEGLTQQEKLELEAYQNSLGLMPENIKTSDENLDSNPELNESVNQLNEETTELLHKIEMYTSERREVMEKLEALTNENSQLLLRIKEIENNRDVLAETYEHLQNEKEFLDEKLETYEQHNTNLLKQLEELQLENFNLRQEISAIDVKHGQQIEENLDLETVAPLQSSENTENLLGDIEEYKRFIEIEKLEIQELKLQLLSQQNLSQTNSELRDAINNLHLRCEALLSENEKLNEDLKINNEIIHEKDSLESDLKSTKQIVKELEMKLKNHLQEIENYQSILEENKNEFISSSNKIVELQGQLEEKQKELEHHQNEISHLNSVVADLNLAISNLETENSQFNSNSDSLEIMSNQLEDLKENLSNNIKQIKEYEADLDNSSKIIADLNKQIKELNNKIIETEFTIDIQNDEIKRLNKEMENKEVHIVKLQEEVNQKSKQFHETFDKMKEKYLTLQNQIDANSGSLDDIKTPLINKIKELEQKNKDQLEKMKKLAANLKKKSNAYIELEGKCTEVSEKWENEQKEKDNLKVTLKNRETAIEESNKKLQDVEQELFNLRNNFDGTVKELEMQLTTLSTENEMWRSTSNDTFNTELSQKDELISNLNQQLETLLYNSKTNSNALQAKIQELQLYIETQDAELIGYRDKANRFEEGLSNVEERRLSLERKAIELGAQLEEKSSNIEEISQTNSLLEQRLSSLISSDEIIERQLQETVFEKQELAEKYRIASEENKQLKNNIRTAHDKINELSIDCEKFVQMENDNLHLNEIILNLECEIKKQHAEYTKKLNERKSEFDAMETEIQNQLDQLNNDKKQLIMKCEQLNDQSKEQHDTQEQLKDEINEYKQKLDQLHAELSNNRSHISSSAPCVDTEELLKLLEEKNLEIQNYQQQNLQLQMQASNQSIDTSQEIQEMKNNLQNAQYQNHVLAEHIKLLENELDKFKNTLTTTAQEAVDNVISEAEIKLSPEKRHTVATFTWPEESSTIDVFDSIGISQQNTQPLITQTVSDNLVQSHAGSNSQDELLKKIKTLEFMLYNVEKEKDEAVIQCHQLTNELTRLVYERENVSKPIKNIQDELDAQILSGQNVDNNQVINELQLLEFTGVSPNFTGPSLQPIDEDLIKPEPAYLCYKFDDAHGSQSEDIFKLHDVETEILSPEHVNMTPEEQKELVNIEFEQIKVPRKKRGVNEPAIEKPITPSTAYLCYKSGNDEEANASSHLNIDAFGENDDGWGWGSEEAKLDVEHRQNLEAVLPENNSETEELYNRIRELELELKQAQIKSGKLLKKLKELKTKNEQLTSELNIKKSSDFLDLNDAIQDELRSQMNNLEKKIRETNLELEREKLEKSHLSKQNDVLTSANERMVDLKQQQQQQNRDLTARLQQFEWGENFDVTTDSKSSDIIELQNKIEELNNIIRDVTLDNEELQAVLEEQKHLRISAERQKSVDPIMENMKTEAEYLNLLSEKNDLNNRLVLINDENEKVLKDFSNLQTQFDQLKSEKMQLESFMVQNNNSTQELSVQLQKLQLENQNLIQANQSMAMHSIELEELKAEVKNLTDSIAEISNKNVKLKEEVVNLSHFNEENKSLLEKLQEKSEEYDKLSEEFQVKQSEFQITIDKVHQEWSQQVEQRGNNVAESWKLHLETRETEFMQLEQQLRKEIFELGEKCNTLAKENNELGKNVDAEMQQQVYELTKVIQEKQTEGEANAVQLNEYKMTINQMENSNKNNKETITSLHLQLKENYQLIQEYEMKLDELKQELITNLRDSEKESTKLTEFYQNQLKDKDAIVENILCQLQENELQKSDRNGDSSVLQQEISALQQQLNEKDQQISCMDQTLQNYIEINLKAELEITQLKTLFDEKTKEYEQNLEYKIQENSHLFNELRQELDSFKRGHEELLTTKTDVEDLKLQLHDQLNKKDLLISENMEICDNTQKDLEEKILACNQLQAKLDEECKQSAELRNIIQEQVLKIEELKTDLYEKCNDYDALFAEVDIQSPPRSQEDRPTLESNSRATYERTQDEDDLSEPVNRAELDLALYMLHQRDVRCEELTVELMQLLEERDTLQLKLSNAIREKEAMAHRTSFVENDDKEQTEITNTSANTSSNSKASAIILGATEATENLKENNKLATKLFELKSVGYGRDKTIVDEQHLRRLQQLSLMQQHRDVAALLPAEAAARLVDASHTLSRDVQSPSKVLLNWLWGRSTPKVNNV